MPSKFFTFKITDESMLMEEANFKIKLIEGDQFNFKITNEIDWELAKVIVEEISYDSFWNRF